MTINFFGLDPKTSYRFVMIFSILIIAPLFGLGSSIFGHKILKNTGKEIILFGRIEAVIIAFVSASLLLLVSVIKGIPTSLVQLNVGAILGIGIAKLGIKNIFRKTEVRQFFSMWIIAPTISFLLSLFLMYLADYYKFI
jgi:sulfate permease